MDKQFQRTVEDFVCEHCGAHVAGSGYTNHCPRCLWSKHVDVNPGDRAATCSGMMEPVEVETKGGEYILVHQCTQCGHRKKNKVVPGDDMQMVIEVARRRE